LDKSQSGISVEHAQQTNKDPKFQAMMSGSGKCRSMTVAASSQIDDWTEQFDRNLTDIKTFAGKNSYGYSGGATRFGSLMGVTIQGTPTVQLVDRSGKVVVEDGRSNPDQVDQYCK
jgi:hypothetical protein